MFFGFIFQKNRVWCENLLTLTQAKYSQFDVYMSKGDSSARQGGGGSLQSEWQLYLKLPSIDHRDPAPLEWWGRNSASFPILSQAARKLLAVPASSGTSERVFWRLGRVSSKERANMKPEIADVLTFLGFNKRL